MNTNASRLPRSHRSPTPPPMLLTDRDVRILEWVHDCRFLTCEQIERLEFGPGAASNCRRRVGLLYHHGYLNRILEPLRDSYGASRAAYYLDRRGAQCLAQLQRAPVEGGGWRSREGGQGELFLNHTLDTATVRIAVARSCRRRGLALEWWDECALRKQQVRERFRGAGGEGVTLIPDAYFTIGDGEAADGFALEVDRATVPERRMRSRFRAYGEWTGSGSYRKRLPVESLRVLVAVTECSRDPERLVHLKSWCEHEGGRSLFWFVDGSDLSTENVLSESIWRVAGEEGQRPLPLGTERT
jgi:hypothetical protein